MEAAVIVGTMTDDQNLIAAAALHDVVEDAEISIEEVEEKFGNSFELKVAIDKRRRKNLGIPHGRYFGWEIYPTKKLQQILDKLQPFPDLDLHKETTIRMPKSNVEIPLRWFEDGGWSKHFYSRAEVRSWLNSMNTYFVELQDLMVAKSLKS